MILSHFSSFDLEAGCDEAGRGCLAGPVFAAAVILPAGFDNQQINDSKKLTEKQRDDLRKIIEEEALAWAVDSAGPKTIDEINILNASILAMHRAIARLGAKPRFLIIDGNRFRPFPGIPHQCIVKGDSKYQSIAAASILAKTHRDAFMKALHLEYPGYRWDRNKGYPTKEHRNAIVRDGITDHHRKSFQLYPDLKIF